MHIKLLYSLTALTLLLMQTQIAEAKKNKDELTTKPIIYTHSAKGHQPGHVKPGPGRYKVALFFTSPDTMVSQIFEDTVTMALEKRGFQVIAAHTLADAISRHIEKQKNPEQLSAPTTLEIAGKTGADLIITGTIITGDIERGMPSSFASIRRVAAMDMFTQLIDTKQGKTLHKTAIHWPAGEGLIQAGRQTVEILFSKQP